MFPMFSDVILANLYFPLSLKITCNLICLVGNVIFGFFSKDFSQGGGFTSSIITLIRDKSNKTNDGSFSTKIVKIDESVNF